MEVSTQKIVADAMFLTDDVTIDGQMTDMGTVDVGNDYVGGVDVPGNYGDMTSEIDTPKVGISTQVILYIVIGVCAAIGIALGIVRGIKVAKK